MTSAIQVSGLSVGVRNGGEIVHEVTFSVERGQVVGLVGESGSGKTTAGLAMLGYAKKGTEIRSGRIDIGDSDVLSLTDSSLRSLRGRTIAYVPQDPGSSLNPALRIGSQLREVLVVHEYLDGATERESHIREVLYEAQLPSDRDFLRRFPHQLSGGQQQRVVIAMAFLCRPRIIVLDEPTTGLDVTTQSRVLSTVRSLCASDDVAAIYVTHDLSVVANIANRILVMYGGEIVEDSPTDELFSSPAHPYTSGLLAAMPDIDRQVELRAIPGNVPAPGRRAKLCSFAPRCKLATDQCHKNHPDPVRVGRQHFASCFHTDRVSKIWVPERILGPAEPTEARDGSEVVLSGFDISADYDGGTQVLNDVSFELVAHQCTALVGESGSGKSTLARCIIGLHPRYRGYIQFCGQTLEHAAASRSNETRRLLQYVFQSPYRALNPRRTIDDTLRAVARHYFGCAEDSDQGRIDQALEQVSLPSRVRDCLPQELSGGERQRAAIARAMVCEPSVLIADEITSALDVSVQAAIINLLQGLQAETGLSLLFVTHDLGLVRSLAREVLVMDGGAVIERGQVSNVLEEPQADYTRELISNTPRLVRTKVPAQENTEVQYEEGA